MLASLVSTTLVVLHLLLAPVSYAGEWTLDLAASRNAPARWQAVERHTLQVTQNDSVMHVIVAMARRGATMPPDTLRYAFFLDGRAVKSTTTVRTPDGPREVPTSTRTTVDADGAVQIVMSMTDEMNGATITSGITERWTLSADGRTLTVHRVDRFPQGTTDWDMVFRRR